MSTSENESAKQIDQSCYGLAAVAGASSASITSTGDKEQQSKSKYFSHKQPRRYNNGKSRKSDDLWWRGGAHRQSTLEESKSSHLDTTVDEAVKRSADRISQTEIAVEQTPSSRRSDSIQSSQLQVTGSRPGSTGQRRTASQGHCDPEGNRRRDGVNRYESHQQRSPRRASCRCHELDMHRANNEESHHSTRDNTPTADETAIQLKCRAQDMDGGSVNDKIRGHHFNGATRENVTYRGSTKPIPYVNTPHNARFKSGGVQSGEEKNLRPQSSNRQTNAAEKTTNSKWNAKLEIQNRCDDFKIKPYLNANGCLVKMYFEKPMTSADDVTSYIKRILRYRIDTSAVLSVESLYDKLSQISSVARIRFENNESANTFLSYFKNRPDIAGSATKIASHNALVEKAYSELWIKIQGVLKKHRCNLTELSEELVRLSGEKENEIAKKYLSGIKRKSKRRNKKTTKNEWLENDKVDERIRFLKSQLKEREEQENVIVHYVGERLRCLFSGLSGDDELVNSKITRLRAAYGLELARFSAGLPTYGRKSHIVQTVLENRVTIITADTGSGKSTQIIQYLFEAFADDPQRRMIVCTQPRKVAAVSLADRVKQEMGCAKLGDLVGYKVGGSQSRRGPNTRVLFATDHSLLNDCIRSDRLFTNYSVVIVDEAHERSIYSDLLIAFLKLALKERKDDFRVVISSATIDSDIFVRYFSGLDEKQPPVLNIPGQKHPVKVIYEPRPVDDDDDYVGAAWKKALELHRFEKSDSGDILVFLTSPAETERARQLLISKSSNDPKLITLEMHGQLNIVDQQKVFKPTPSGKRKIVFATNCAETSITIPGIRYVVDSGRVRELRYDPERSMSSLNVQKISKSSADQRKGRAGRTAPGVCYRLYPREYYEETAKFTMPEILRIHLGHALLKLMSLGVRDPQQFDFVESPTSAAISDAITVLQELGACTVDGLITEVGQKLIKLSIEPRFGKIILCGIDAGVTSDAVIAAAVCSVGGNIFFRAGSDDEKHKADLRKTRFCNRWGDVTTMIEVFYEWERLPERQRNQWCVENSINAKSMRYANDVVKDIKHTLKHDLHIDVARNHLSNSDAANDVVAKIIFECFFSNLCMFSGHVDLGYYLASNHHETLLHIHPSSALTYADERCQWLVFERILTTSRAFLINVTPVEESWIAQKLVQHDMAAFDIDKLKQLKVIPRIINGISGSFMKQLRQYNGQRQAIETDIKQTANMQDQLCAVHLDVISNSNKGRIVLYASQNVLNHAVSFVESHILKMQRGFLDETVEIQLGAENVRQVLRTIRLVITSGAVVQTVMMPGDVRTLQISCTKPSNEKTIEEMLCAFGEIERIIKFEHKALSSKLHQDLPIVTADQIPSEVSPLEGTEESECARFSPDNAIIGNASCWGTVTFKHTESASLALATSTLETESLPFALSQNADCDDYGGRHVGSVPTFRGKFAVAVTLRRARQLHYGYVTFGSVEDASLAVARLDNFTIRKHDGNNHERMGHINIKTNENDRCQAFIDSIPEWADNECIRQSLVSVLDGYIDAAKVNVRIMNQKINFTDKEHHEQVEQFKHYIEQLLLRDETLRKTEYLLKMAASRTTAPLLIAYVNFIDHEQAERAVVNLDKSKIGIPLNVLTAELVLRTSLFVSDFVYSRSISEIDRKKKEVEEHEVKITPKRKFGGYAIEISASCFYDLVLARKELGIILNGERIDIQRQAGRLTTKRGKTLLEQIAKQTRTRIRLDERQLAVFIHGDELSIGEAKRSIISRMEVNDDIEQEVVAELPLTGINRPKGLMKILAKQYGVELAGLKEESKAEYLEILFRSQSISFRGTPEARQLIEKRIDEIASSIIDGSAETANHQSQQSNSILQTGEEDCPVCLNSINYEECYVLEGCGHVCCEQCVRGLIHNGLAGTQLPIECVRCSTPLTLEDLRQIYPSDTSERCYPGAVGLGNSVIEAAVRNFVNVNANKYAFCVTPDCRGIYNKKEEQKRRRKPRNSEERADVGSLFECPECFTAICTRCNVVFHEGQTCEMYRHRKSPALSKWIDRDPVNRYFCPHCHVPIEKRDGCDHVRCPSCQKHICWKCKEHFNHSTECYDHLKRQHGNIYPEK